jgi:hypothetical protein
MKSVSRWFQCTDYVKLRHTLKTGVIAHPKDDSILSLYSYSILLLILSFPSIRISFSRFPDLLISLFLLAAVCVARCVRTFHSVRYPLANMQIIAVSVSCINAYHDFQSTPNVYATKRTMQRSGCLSAE